jgi:hypothetical protein
VHDGVGDELARQQGRGVHDVQREAGEMGPDEPAGTAGVLGLPGEMLVHAGVDESRKPRIRPDRRRAGHAERGHWPPKMFSPVHPDLLRVAADPSQMAGP